MEQFIDFSPSEAIEQATKKLGITHVTIARASGLSPSAICLLSSKKRSLGVRFTTAKQLYLGLSKLYEETSKKESTSQE